MKVESRNHQDSLITINQFVNMLVEVNDNRSIIGSYVNCLKKQFALSKLPWSVLSITQNRKEILIGIQNLWVDFFSSLPCEIVNQFLKTLNMQMRSMYSAIPDEESAIEKEDYIYIQFITPLHLAAWCGCLELVSLLHTQSLPVWDQYITFPDLLGNLPIHCCFFSFNYWPEPLSFSIQLAELFNSSLASYNVLGFAPLHIACIANQSQAILYLREQEVDITIPVHFFNKNISEALDNVDIIRDVHRFQTSTVHTDHPSFSDSYHCGSCSSIFGSMCSYEGSFDERYGIRESDLFLAPMTSTNQSGQYELEGYLPLHMALLSNAPYCAFLLLRSVEDLLHTTKSVVMPLEVLTLNSYAVFSYLTSIHSKQLFDALPKEWHSLYSPNQDLLQSTLLNGIISRNYTSIIKILSTNINLNANYFMHSFSPLHIVCVLLDETFIRLFIGYGANPCKFTSDHDSCLHLILKSQSKVMNEYHKSKLLGLLIMSGSDPNACDGKGCTPLFYAVQQHDLHAIKLLLAYGADPSIHIPNYHSVFHYAIQKGDEAIVRLLFSRSPGLLSSAGINGHLPLYYVIRYHNLALLTYLLNHTLPLSNAAIADLECAFHDYGLKSLYECVKKQLGSINRTSKSTNRHNLYFFLPNHMVEQCMQCHKRFSILTVRRHCRKCGQVLCTNCCQDDADKQNDHICGKCRKTNESETTRFFLQQFEDGIKSYLVRTSTL